MTLDNRNTEAAQDYSAAYAVHYTAKDLHEALKLYSGIISAHPDSEEAKYSQSQIINIVNAVIPKQELHDAQVAMATAHLKNGN